jgi:hypothetical protein
MSGLIGAECNVWLVMGLLALALGLGGALLAAVRRSLPETRRTR